MSDICEAFENVQKSASQQGVSAKLIWRDKDGYEMSFSLSEARIEVEGPKYHPSLFGENNESL